MTLTASTTEPVHKNQKTSPQRVLVMDDNPNLRYIYIQALHEVGYEAYPAATIQEARDLLATYDFDVFLADTHVGGQDDGANLLSEQAETFAKNGTKIVMVSSQSQYRALCEKMGVDVFIEKPVAINRLVEVVNRLMS